MGILDDYILVKSENRISMCFGDGAIILKRYFTSLTCVAFRNNTFRHTTRVKVYWSYTQILGDKPFVILLWDKIILTLLTLIYQAQKVVSGK